MQYKQRSELFSYDALRCLRNDYFHNDCQECKDICPENAWYFERGQLRIDPGRCTNCSVCLGVCPAEALGLEFFDPNEYAMRCSEVLSCKKDLPCLSAFASEHFVAMALKRGGIGVDLSHCAQCTLNKDGKVLASIQERLEEARAFLRALGLEAQIEERAYRNDRRSFFKTLFNAAKTMDSASMQLPPAPDRLPIRRNLLQQLLKPLSKDLSASHIPTSFSFIANKQIDAACTNCGDCVQFCPTQALSYSPDGAAISFVAGYCIDCAICNDICKVDAITDTQTVDIVAWAFARARELIRHRIEVCQECNTPFAYKGGEMVCDRCKQFVDAFGDIFKLASDMEES